MLDDWMYLVRNLQAHEQMVLINIYDTLVHLQYIKSGPLPQQVTRPNTNEHATLPPIHLPT